MKEEKEESIVNRRKREKSSRGKGQRVKRALCLCLALFCLLSGQPLCRAEKENKEVSVDPTGNGGGYSAVLYDNTNGLPTSETNSIIETAEGFIWIGTYSGLIRYDGNTFERIDSTTGIASVMCLYADSKNRLWIGLNDSGAAVMEQGEFHFFRKSDGLRSASVRSIAEDADGVIYLATTHGMVWIDEALDVHPIEEERIRDEYIREVRTGADGTIYGVTINGAVFTMRGQKLTAFYDGSDMGISDIITVFPDPEHPDRAYLGTEQSSVFYVEIGTALRPIRVLDVSPLAYVKCIEQFGDQMWICADNGVGVIRDGSIQIIENLPMNNSIDHVIADYEGNLWFTSSRQGVMKIVQNQFRDIFACYDIPSTVVNGTCLSEGRLFIGSDTGLIVLDENGRVDSLPLERAVTAGGEKLGETDLIEMLDGCRIRSVIRDSKGRLWLAGWRKYGLIRYDGREVVCFTQKDGLPSDRIRVVCERKDGSILAACTGGAAVIEGDRITYLYDEKDGLTNTEILTVAEAGNGDIVLGSDGDGIYVLHDGAVTCIGMDRGLGSEIVMRVKWDEKRGLFWIVTSNSIAYMTADYRVETIRAFPYSNNFDMIENSAGEMWILASNGVYVTSAESLLANGDISPVYYSRDNGLPCIATANSYSDVSDEGVLYISGSTGVAAVNIETPFENVGDLKMSVPFVKADGVWVYPDESGTITIPSSVKKLTVYSYVYNYSLLNPQVTYHLEGFEQTSTTVRRSELQPVDYTNLKGGSYRFVIQLHDAMGRGGKELSVPIVKVKGVREQLWYRVARILAALLLVFGVVKFYNNRKTRALIKKQKETNTFIREMTEAFARIIDMKDKYTNGHSLRVAQYTAILTRELGYDEETVEKYYNIALLHDIGKIGIPPEVLNKRTSLATRSSARCSPTQLWAMTRSRISASCRSLRSARGTITSARTDEAIRMG
ncbi:MAG: HD domain-containing protein [Oscillospiraceae bacterium]|nr:HD domain-containing protein [Oscillospiraceae bacterium]